MSWGERSCKNMGNCPSGAECTMTTCRVCCGFYQWDGKTMPDTDHYFEKVVPIFDHGREVGKTRLCHFCGKRAEDYTMEMDKALNT